MNDNAIEKRTKLRLEDEAERQLQLLEDLKLEKRFERSQKGIIIRFLVIYVNFFFSSI